MSERPTLQHMCLMKGEWPSCLYFPHNQPWCHHEPSLNRPLSKNISLSPSPLLLIFHLSLLHSPGCLPPVRILLVKPHFFFLLFIRFFPFMPPLQLSLSLFRFRIQAHSVPGSRALIESAQVKPIAKSTRMFWLRRALFKRWPFQNRFLCWGKESKSGKISYG